MQIPVPVLQISATQHPVKAGLSDAFMILNPSPDVPGESLRSRNGGEATAEAGQQLVPQGCQGSPGIAVGRGGRRGGQGRDVLVFGHFKT